MKQLSYYWQRELHLLTHSYSVWLSFFILFLCCCFFLWRFHFFLLFSLVILYQCPCFMFLLVCSSDFSSLLRVSLFLWLSFPIFSIPLSHSLLYLLPYLFISSLPFSFRSHVVITPLGTFQHHHVGQLPTFHSFGSCKRFSSLSFFIVTYI